MNFDDLPGTRRYKSSKKARAGSTKRTYANDRLPKLTKFNVDLMESKCDESYNFVQENRKNINEAVELLKSKGSRFFSPDVDASTALTNRKNNFPR